MAASGNLSVPHHHDKLLENIWNVINNESPRGLDLKSTAQNFDPCTSSQKPFTPYVDFPRPRSIRSELPPIMREIAEFRVLEKYAPRLFADHEGRKLGSGEVRKIEIDTSDPRYPSIGETQRRIWEETATEESGRFFFYGWLFHRKYSEDELKAASCLLLTISAAFEPVGEQCGTDYDDTAACPKCGAGALNGEPAPWICEERLRARTLCAPSLTNGSFPSDWQSE